MLRPKSVGYNDRGIGKATRGGANDAFAAAEYLVKEEFPSQRHGGSKVPDPTPPTPRRGRVDLRDGTVADRAPTEPASPDAGHRHPRRNSVSFVVDPSRRGAALRRRSVGRSRPDRKEAGADGRTHVDARPPAGRRSSPRGLPHGARLGAAGVRPPRTLAPEELRAVDHLGQASSHPSAPDREGRRDGPARSNLELIRANSIRRIVAGAPPGRPGGGLPVRPRRRGAASLRTSF